MSPNDDNNNNNNNNQLYQEQARKWAQRHGANANFCQVTGVNSFGEKERIRRLATVVCLYQRRPARHRYSRWVHKFSFMTHQAVNFKGPYAENPVQQRADDVACGGSGRPTGDGHARHAQAWSALLIVQHATRCPINAGQRSQRQRQPTAAHRRAGGLPS
uniref:SCP domain-containing protein n=1 Tax=Trichuris muris TaxID=70415 RepID=A0A5S6QX29_TRIMR